MAPANAESSREPREIDPLLPPDDSIPSFSAAHKAPLDGAAFRGDADSRSGESFDDVPAAKRQLGLVSAVFLIFNRIIGTGIYATSSIILRSSGSVGVSFIIWLVGSLVAAAGTAVYIELGTGLPRSGGEKNYLEFIYRRPRFLATCVYATYAVLIGSSSANSVIFGEYFVHSLSLPPTQWNIRASALACITFVLIMHSCFLKWGLHLQNALGFFKLFILLAIALFGMLSLTGVPGFEVREGCEVPNNFEWEEMWKGSGTGINAFVTGLYNVIWCYIGYSNANYALSEIRDPVRTIKRAAPLALLWAVVVYMFVNIAYLAVVSKADILGSRGIVAALFFRNLFGSATERVLSIIIALSTLGNVLSVMFTQGRVVQELGREGVLPYSWFFASNKPFNAPFPGIFAQWLVSAIYMLASPPGDAYLFMLNFSSYPLAMINTFVSGGLLLLYSPSYKVWDWNPPFRAPQALVVSFFISNLFLIIVPLVPPIPGSEVYDYLPYWSHVVAAILVSSLGVVYWYVWSVWTPRRKGYTLVRRVVLQEDGVSRNAFQKVPI